MARIEGDIYLGAGTISTNKDYYMEWTVTSPSFSNNNCNLNIKTYFYNVSTSAFAATTNRPVNIIANGVTYNTTFSNGILAIGNTSLVAESNFTIPYLNDGTKTISVSSLWDISDGGFYDYGTVSGTIELPKLSNGHINVSGTWKNAFYWIKKLGVWKRAVIWIKINGVWKKGI